MFEMETLVIVDQLMQSKGINFSKAVNLLIKQADYLLRKVTLLREEQKVRSEEAKNGGV